MFQSTLVINPEVLEKCVKAMCFIHNFIRASENGLGHAVRGAGAARGEPTSSCRVDLSKQPDQRGSGDQRSVYGPFQ